MKRVRLDLRGMLRAECPACGAPCWLHRGPLGSLGLGWLHRVPVCRWFNRRAGE